MIEFAAGKKLLATAVGVVALAGLVSVPRGSALGQEAHNMRLVGLDDLQGRSAYQPIVQEYQDGRWIAFVGHHGGSALNPLTGVVENNGVSILDVTNPSRPVYLHHLVPTDGQSGSQMVRTCSGDDLPDGVPGRMYLLRTNGNLGHHVYDVTDPSNPVLVSTPSTGLDGTHKNWWECESGIAYLVSGVPGWRTTRMTQIFDLSDPANPVFIRNFGLPGQEPGSTGDVPTSLHGCIPVPDRDRVYCGHGTSSNGIFVIYDRDKLLNDPLADPLNPSVADLNFPLIARLDTPLFMGAHTTFPVLGIEVEDLAKDPAFTTRDFVALINEAGGNQCSTRTRQMVFMVDITDETKPFPVSNFNVREDEGDFCDRGGRFGAHASNESFTPLFYRKLIVVSWFNAGVRAIDIRDPFNPKQAAYFIPRINENTDERCASGRECDPAIQTNNVEVDDRGFIYLADRALTGLHIVELTGDAKKIID